MPPSPAWYSLADTHSKSWGAGALLNWSTVVWFPGHKARGVLADWVLSPRAILFRPSSCVCLLCEVKRALGEG